MKKYRVVTDNLNWVGIPKGTELHEQIDSFYSFIPGSVAGYAVKNQYDIYAVIAAHPEWLSEIKEDKEELIDHRIKYSENDLLKFGRLVRRTFNFTDSDSVVQSLLSDYKAAKFSPKEEAKEFTRKDMCVFASYAHCYHSKKLSYDALLSEWEGYYHNQ